jgi:hypothetical protein
MKGKKIIQISLLFALLLSAVSFQQVVAAEKTVKLTIVNNTRKDIVFKFEGPKEYEFTVEGLETEDFTVIDGKYDYRWEACGEIVDGNMEIGKNTKIVIYPCGEIPSKMRVKNHLGLDVSLELNGPDDYDFAIEPGKNTVYLLSGDYVFGYSACNNTIFEGEIHVQKNGQTELRIHSCEWYTDPLRNVGRPNPVKVRIVNHATFDVDMYLVGPETYYLTLSPGVNRLLVLSGTYEYGYYVDYTLHSGTFVIKPNGLSLLSIKPAHIFILEEELEVE